MVSSGAVQCSALDRHKIRNQGTKLGLMFNPAHQIWVGGIAFEHHWGAIRFTIIHITFPKDWVRRNIHGRVLHNFELVLGSPSTNLDDRASKLGLCILQILIFDLNCGVVNAEFLL